MPVSLLCLHSVSFVCCVINGKVKLSVIMEDDAAIGGVVYIH
jgi:hypothetical protein